MESAHNKKAVVGLLWGSILVVAAICLRVFGKVNDTTFGFLLIAGVAGGFLIANYDFIKKLKTPGGWEFETVRGEINKAKDEAIEQIRQEVTAHKEAIAELVSKAKEQDKKLRKTMELAAPPTLALYGAPETTKTEKGYKTILIFRPSKNEPFGQLSFVAVIQKASSGKIINLWPHVGPPCATGPHSQQKSENGREAGLVYSLMTAGWPQIELMVSEPCIVLIWGSHIPEPFQMEIGLDSSDMSSMSDE